MGRERDKERERVVVREAKRNSKRVVETEGARARITIVI